VENFMPHKIILIGATGLIGKYLFWELNHLGDEVIIFTRNPGESVFTIVKG
jgi:NAD dependent epimerase/dehydratase family enzyme